MYVEPQKKKEGKKKKFQTKHQNRHGSHGGGCQRLKLGQIRRWGLLALLLLLCLELGGLAFACWVGHFCLFLARFFRQLEKKFLEFDYKSFFLI